MGAKAGKITAAKSNGTSSSKGSQQGKGLAAVTDRAAERSGRSNISGRYHRHPKTFDHDYTLMPEVLGEGYNGQVRLATNKITKRQFAIKYFKLRGIDAEKRAELESEAEIFLAMDHPHVASLVDCYESKEQLDLVMERMTGGELFDRVLAKKRFSEKDGADAMYQMLLAINYIHSHGIVHRDIKLENFLYESQDSNYLKLIDFGFSKIWEKNTTMAASCGTLAYVAPEVMSKSYTSQCDLWSLGVTAFILLFGYMPFSGSEAQQIRNIQDGKYGYKKEVWAKVSKDGQDFVKQLLVVDPKKRMTAQKAMEHPWLAIRESHDASVDEALMKDLCNFGKASSFRRACMGVLSWSLTLEERQQVREAFLALDKNHCGTITLSEFKQAVEENFHIEDEAIEKAFQALDANHKDEINYHEFLAAMVSSRIALHDDLLKVTFNRFDTDNSGFITADNLREVLGETFEGEQVEQLMKEADFTHDGKISYEEWIRYLKGGDGAVKDNHADAAVRLIDTQLEKAVKQEEEAPALPESPVGRQSRKLRTKNVGTVKIQSAPQTSVTGDDVAAEGGAARTDVPAPKPLDEPLAPTTPQDSPPQAAPCSEETTNGMCPLPSCEIQ
eukprot:TRINITY_DN32465_c0_g1_i1.p1 TRINITY_DN32465_c0_g1~~TRINITY_DN32465_c0_g1_i1.p1  ORF type:complete len:627 (+),score=159.20 TRINITY_DN32465_c0_g1_i1:41-1882(+)